MFKTKLEVDRHVDNCLKKINNETERNLRCFSFGKLYFNVGDYEQACRYASSYLSVKPRSAEGHQLLGKCLEKLGKKEAALEAYRNSLQLDPKQNNLVIKVCELLSLDDVDMDQSGARYFCDLAQSFDPNNPAVYTLKERLITTDSDNPTEVSQLLLKELESRPADVNLRVRLLKHFLQHNMIKEAYKHASAIEQKNLSIFHNSLSWYETFAQVLVRFQRDLAYSSQLTWEFWFLSVSVLDRVAALSLDDYTDNIKISSEYIANLFNFDQMLATASQNITGCTDRQLVSAFLNHYHAQLYFHVATLVFKQAKKDLIHFKEAANITLPVLFAAYHTPPPDLQSMWLAHCSDSTRKLVQHWHKAASFRCSQTGHVLLAAAKDRKSLLIDKATQYSTGMWREQLFKKVFVKRDQQLKMSTSYFVSQPLEVIIKLPEQSDLLGYDEVAQLVYPDSLHHYIWLGLNNNHLAQLEVRSFEGLQYSVKNLSNCGAEALSLLDVQAFIYCATLCAQSKLEDTKHVIYFNQDKPAVLPASITENLGTLNQSKFLAAAYKMYNNEPGANMGDLRLLLIKGIEVIRCVGHHGLDVKLLVALAQVFEERSKNLTKQSEVEFVAARAELYWKTALPLLDKIKNNQAITYSSNRLFEYRSKEMTIAEATGCIEKGKLFTATQLMKKKDYDKALHIFQHLKDPYASFYQAQIYKHMADQKTNQRKENVTSEMRSQNIILLSRARDCLYLTLDRLREPSVDREHPLNAQLGTEIEKMERLLSRIDPDCANRNECDGMSDDNSSDNSVAEHYLSTYTNHNSFHNGHGGGGGGYTSKLESHNNHSTPLRLGIARQEARPSPERLDAQIRQLVASRDVALSGILEQNKVIAESHKGLLEELRSFKDAVNNLTSMVDDMKTMKRGFEELKDVKKSVDDLKHSVDELQNVVDVVQEMKKELNELKKDHNKTNQLSDEDLYVLDPDYGVDYNLGANGGGFGNAVPGVYPNYHQAGRLPNPNPLAAYAPPTLYPGLYPGLAYAYGSLGLSQPGTLPFVSDPHQLQGLAASGVAGFPPPVLAQPPLNQSLTGAGGLGVNLMTGQPLSQVATQTNQLAKDSTKTPNIVSTSSFTSLTPVSSTMAVVSKAAPVNVVITSSDPLPLHKTPTTQPILSVTIPPQHIKGSAAAKTQLATTTSLFSSSAVSASPATSSSLFSGLSLNKTPAKNLSLGLQIEKTLEETFSSPKIGDVSNKSNISTSSVEEHDPCPDFKPIIPLPDEVPISTGEECETELFCNRAKLFRHVNNKGTKEWKERGVGNLKILHNPETGKVRLLMRRDQVHKICANHFLTKDMTLKAMANNDKAYIWAAQDFADEEVVAETFCVRFKTPEEGSKFYEAFEDAKKLLDKPPEKAEVKSTEKRKEVSESQASQPASTLGGFVFTSTPTFKPKEAETPTKATGVQETPKNSPFTAFTFGKSSNLFQQANEAPKFSPLVIAQNYGDDEGSHTAEEFVPTQEFKPVIALPDLVEVKTGEENSEVLFEARAKLFRLDTSGDTKEWKERGVGPIKVLKDDSIRLLMRRDQVHKVCCNHTIIKDMLFKINANNPKAVFWHAQDFSEGVLTPETFTARFKTVELANQFLQTVQSAQTSLDESNKVGSKHHKPEARPRTTSFGEKFKPAKGSWECKNCYIVNDGKTSHCVACETPKSGAAEKKTEESGAVFSFGVAANKTPEPSGGSFVFGQSAAAASGWGNAFKPAEGSWECNSCFVRNSGDASKCVSCSTAKAGATATTDTKPKGVNLETAGLKFNFGVPKKEEVKPAVAGFGEAFKPKVGSWECKMCMVRNNADVSYCASCETPKDDTVPKKETNKGVDLSTPGQKFVFGIPSAASPQLSFGSGLFGTAKTPLSTTTTTTTTAQVTFASTTNFDPKPASVFKPPTSNTFTFKPTQQPEQPPSEEDQSKFVFGSPQKHDFEFKPRSPRRISSGQGDEESDGSYVEEEEDNIYFKPVIPLPDKVEVKTGEEEEEVLYYHRAKLFRFVEGEWKERGLGDIKVLKRKDNGKLRVVMRREQVLKICLNHVLTREVQYLPKDEKSWLFHAYDFSEGELIHEQFCVRFKTPEVAQEFRKAVCDAVEGAAGGDQGQKTTGTNQLSDDDEVEIVSETQVTSEEEKEAIRLGLPPKFLAYKQLPDCTCAQCQKDDEYLKELFTNDKKPTSQSSSKISTSFGTPSTGDSVFGTPKGLLFNFTPQQRDKEDSTSETLVAENKSTPRSDTLRDILLKPSMLASSPTKASPVSKIPEETTAKPFSFSSALGQLNLSTSGGNSLFGSPAPPTSGGLFGATTTTTGGSIFGATTTTTTGGSIFSSPATTSSGSIFANATTASGGSIFGTNLFNSSSTTTSLFSTPTSSIFAAKSSSGSSLFSSTASITPLFGSGGSTPVFGSTTSSTSNIFGANAATTTTTTTNASSASAFGTTSNVFTLGNNPTFGGGANLFGGGSTVGVAAKQDQQPVKSTTELKEDDEVVLKCDSTVSFATLAANTAPDAKPAFSKTGDGSFSFLGAGAPVFGSKKANTSKTQSDDEGGSDGQDEGEYDPHYEPIVPLPEAIVVTTGEENETALFNERAKLFRFDADTKEWKERGVGQMKVLHHPQNNTYRLLLRREQVFKVVLNQLIVPSLELQPMLTSDKAWMWAGYNYTDDGNCLEKLAIRFKNVELAKQFYAVMENVIGKVSEMQNNSKTLPVTVQNYGLEDVSCEEQNATAEDDDDDEYEDEEDEDDEDDRSVMFMKRCTLSEAVTGGTWRQLSVGDIQVYYDPELYAARVSFNDDSGRVLSNTLIGVNTLMEINKNECVWKSVEWAQGDMNWRTLKASFSSQIAAQEFHSNYLEGLNYAQQVGIVDEVPLEHDTETDD